MIQNNEKLYSKLMILNLDEKKRLKNYDGLILFSKSFIGKVEGSYRSNLIEEIVEREKNYPTFIDKMGVDNDKFLNYYEKDYFKYKFETNFNFDNKIIGYIYYDENGKHYQTKMEYFNKLRKRQPWRYFEYKDELIVESNKTIKLGIYNAIIVINRITPSNNQTYNPYNLLYITIVVIAIALGTLTLLIIAKRLGYHPSFITSFIIIFLLSLIQIIILAGLVIIGLSEIIVVFNALFFLATLFILFLMIKLILKYSSIDSFQISFYYSILASIVMYIITSWYFNLTMV